MEGHAQSNMLLQLFQSRGYKNDNLPFLQGIRLNIFSFTPTITEAEFSLHHLGKSILEGNLYLGPLEIIL